MPTFITSDEFRRKSTMPAFELFQSCDAVKIPHLSDLIGGDALISPWRARPKDAKKVTRHLEKGAVIVEIKRGADLPSSLLGRNAHLEKQAVRMIATGAQSHQRILLYTGFHAPTPFAKLRIGTFNGERVTWRSTEWDYIHFMRARTKLMDSGLLRWEGLSANHELPIWFADKLRHLIEYQTKPVKTLRKFQKTPSRETLRELKIADDARGILALFDHIGLNGAENLMQHCGNRLVHVIEFLTDPANAGKCRGIGKKTIDSFRAQLGLINPELERHAIGLDGGGWADCGLFVLPLEGGKRWCSEHKTTYWDKICPICKLKESPSCT